LEFATGDHVFLRVTQTISVGRAICSRKLSPMFFGPYQILRRIKSVAYEITLPYPSQVLEVEDVQIREDLSVDV